jgi:poly(3-hydroxybutyrate) depolymerase
MKIYILLSLFLALSINAQVVGSFDFTSSANVTVPVYYVAPEVVNDKTRLVVVMHGRQRNAETYRDQWTQSSKELNLLVVVPEFSEEAFPGVFGFNYGNVFSQTLAPVEKDLQAFSIVKPLVDKVTSDYKISNKWGIYGHGAGAHFVHRYALHRPDASYTLAIAANLGWYLSMTDQAWPFGLRDSGIDDLQLKQAFSKYFLLMLGRADTSTQPNTPYVAEHFDTIKLQGEHRLARGRNFFKSAVTKSKELDEFFKWGMVEVPTTKGHSNTEQMVPYAAEMFYARLR